MENGVRRSPKSDYSRSPSPPASRWNGVETISPERYIQDASYVRRAKINFIMNASNGGFASRRDFFGGQDRGPRLGSSSHMTVLAVSTQRNFQNDIQVKLGRGRNYCILPLPILYEEIPGYSSRESSPQHRLCPLTITPGMRCKQSSQTSHIKYSTSRPQHRHQP